MNDKRRRQRRIHYAFFDFLTTVIVIGILLLLVHGGFAALDYEVNQYNIAKENARDELPLEVKLERQRLARRANITHKPEIIELNLITDAEVTEVETNNQVITKTTTEVVNKAKTEERDDGYLGRFRITHYCDCEICQGAYVGTTATGVTPTAGRTIAVDPRVIPLGTRVTINGHEYVAEDTGGAIRGNRIDIFVASHAEANEKGVYWTDVYRNI